MSGGEPERSGPKNYVSRAVSGSRKKSAAERSAEREVAEWARAVNEDHRNGNAERQNNPRQNSPLRSAPMLCTGVIESVLRK